MTPDRAEPAEAGDGPLVFVSYAREDEEWLRRFEVMLQPEVRRRGLRLWIDRSIGAGREWRPAIEHAIARTSVALLLVSPDFLASKYIMDEELPALVARGVPLVIVLLRRCRHDAIEDLASVQWAHDPQRPIAQARDVDGSIVRATDALMAVVTERGDGDVDGGVTAPDEVATRSRVPALVASDRQGPLHGVPEHPAGFVARDELDALRAALLAAGGGGLAITGGRRLGLHGQGGIGKTVLAATLARDPVVRSHFPDGVFWVPLGESQDLVAAQLDLLARLDSRAGTIRSSVDGVEALRSALAERRCLLVVDDVWTAAAAHSFDVGGPRCRVLYTTRDATTLREVCSEVRRIDVLSEAAASQLLAALAGTGVDELPDDVDRILEATGRVALALAIVGAAVGRGGRSWREIADELDEAADTFLVHPYADVFKAMGIAVASLDPAVAAAHRTLAVYLEDARVPIAAVVRLWSHAFGFTPGQTRDVLQELAQRELLSMDAHAITLHDMQRDFLLLRVESLRLLHHDLVDAYRRLLPSPQAPWSELSPGEPYIWEHLVEHLIGAGDAPGAARVVRDLGFVAIRAFRAGPHAAEVDARRVAALAPGDPAVRWVLDRLSRWGHLLSDHDAIGDVAATLALRTADQPPTIDATGLGALLPLRALRARWGLREAPAALRRVLDNRSNAVLAVTYSPDGRTLASAGGDGIVQLWDPLAGTQIARLKGHRNGVRAIAFTPDPRKLASAGHDGTLRVWDLAAGTPLAVFDVHSGFVHAVAFSPDGRTLAVSGERDTKLWDTLSGTQTTVVDVVAYTLTFSAVGRVLASADYEGGVKLWDADADSGEQVASFDGGRYGASHLAFSPDGRTLALGGVLETVQLWDVDTLTRGLVCAGHRGGVKALGFSLDGRHLVVGTGGERMHMWDVTSGSPVNVFESHRNGNDAIAFSPDEATLATGGGDGTVKLWDLRTRARFASPPEHEYEVGSVALSRGGKRVASAGGDTLLRLWDVTDGAFAVLQGHHSVRAVAFSADGRTLASAHGDGAVRLWDMTDDARTAVLRMHMQAAVSADAPREQFPRPGLAAIAFSPDGRTVVTGGDDGKVRLWDADAGVSTIALEGHRGHISAVAVSPDGRTVASGANESWVRLWDVATGTQRAALEGHPHYVHAVAFSHDGSTLASAGARAAVKLWDASTDQLVASFDAPHRWGVQALAFSPDGRALASGDRDGTLRMWDLTTRTPILAVRLGGPIGALAFDGARGIALGIHKSVAYVDLVDRAEIAAAPR